jgi:hypothetical protein
MADAPLSLALVELVLDPKVVEKYGRLSAAEQQSLFDFLCLSRGALWRAHREAAALSPAVARVSLDRFLRRCQEVGLTLFEIEAS